MNAARPSTGPMPGKTEFVLLIAAMMAGNAVGIDSMLPALPAIGDALGVTDENRRQLIITCYMLGFGSAQLVYGPLADRYGRKHILIGCMICYAAFAALCGLAASFPMLLAMRAMHGIAAAGSRVLVVAVVRDRFRGAAMAQMMSSAQMVFMLMPVLAPSLGQLVLFVASWRSIFFSLSVYALLLALWGGMRLPETLDEASRRPLTAAHFAAAVRETLTNRVSIGNTAASTIIFGALFGFIGSIQQVIFDVFHRPGLIGLVFAIMVLPMGMSAWLNSRLVLHFGSRRILLAAIAGFTCVAALHLALILAAGESLWTFVALQALTMGWFGLIGANAGALAMEPMGHIAGTASSLQGLISTIFAALIGLGIGQLFDGTTIPLVAGFAVCGAMGLLVSRWANAGLPAHSRNELSEPVEPPLA